MRYERFAPVAKGAIARAVREYDRGLTAGGDEVRGSGAGSGACTEGLAHVFDCRAGLCGGSKTVTKPDRGS